MAESRIKLLKNCWSTEIREDSDICLKKKLWKKKGTGGRYEKFEFLLYNFKRKESGRIFCFLL